MDHIVVDSNPIAGNEEIVKADNGNCICDLALLSKAAIGLVELPPEVDIYKYIGEQLHEFIGSSIIVVNSFDQNTHCFQIRALLGIGGLMEAFLRVLGRNPIGMSTPIDDVAMVELSSGRLRRVPGGLYELSIGAIPKSKCQAIEKLFNLTGIYAIGFTWRKKLYGSIAILMRGSNELCNPLTIETFVSQASVALQRYQAEDALRKANDGLEQRVKTRTIELEKVNELLRIEISERKCAEEALDKQRKEYRIIFDSVHPIIAYLNKDGKVLRVNKAGAAVMGLEPKEAINKNLCEFLIPDKKTIISSERAEIIKSGIPKLGMVTQISLLSGEKRWVQYDRIPYCDDDNNTIGIILFMQDITQQKLAEDNLEKSYKDLQRTFEGSINAMAKMVELRDPYTSGHQRRVANLASAIAKEMNLSEEQVKYIHVAGLIHDCGKIYIPSDILSKPTKLTEPEFQIIKTHSQGSWEILKSIEFPWPIAHIALQHHERLNGSGYPNALKGEDILIEARILAVADVVEAMASHRPYRPALGLEYAKEEISLNANILYDRKVVTTCIGLISEAGFKFN